MNKKHLRLSVLHKSTSIIVVLPPAMSHLLLLHSVLPSPVPLDQADHDADAEEEDEGQDHPNEPPGAGHRALVHLVHRGEGGVGVHVLVTTRRLVHTWAAKCWIFFTILLNIFLPSTATTLNWYVRPVSRPLTTIEFSFNWSSVFSHVVSFNFLQNN